MDNVEVSTVVYLPPEDVYEFLVDFPGYARYSKYLKEVRRDGDGDVGTRYDMTFAWWKLSYTLRSEVTDVDPPTDIGWTVVEDIDANGRWHVESAPEAAPPDRDHASRIILSVGFDPDSASADAVDLPRLVSLDWVIAKVKPLVQDEAERIVERIVADLEGERRDVELQVHAKPDSV